MTPLPSGAGVLGHHIAGTTSTGIRSSDLSQWDKSEGLKKYGVPRCTTFAQDPRTVRILMSQRQPSPIAGASLSTHIQYVLTPAAELSGVNRGPLWGGFLHAV